MDAITRNKEIKSLAKKLLQQHPNGCNVNQLLELAGAEKASDVLAMVQYLIEKKRRPK